MAPFKKERVTVALTVSESSVFSPASSHTRARGAAGRRPRPSVTKRAARLAPPAILIWRVTTFRGGCGCGAGRAVAARLGSARRRASRLSHLACRLLLMSLSTYVHMLRDITSHQPERPAAGGREPPAGSRGAVPGRPPAPGSAAGPPGHRRRRAAGPDHHTICTGHNTM